MPVLKNRTVLELARNLRGFLSLEMGLTRGPVPDSERMLQQARSRTKKQSQQLTQARGQLSQKARQLAQARERFSESERRLALAQDQLLEKDLQVAQVRERASQNERKLARLREEAAARKVPSVEPENVVWIFGFGRSGSTWLSFMLNELEGYALWHEPLIGTLFGNLYYNVSYYGIEVGDILRYSKSSTPNRPDGGSPVRFARPREEPATATRSILTGNGNALP